MTVFNGERFIREAVESCLNQTHDNLELIIIDDGSTDSSLEIINSFQDERIKLLINKSNKGQSFSRNWGIKEAKGEYIAIMDSDDVAYPDRIKKQLDYLKAKDAEICFTWADIIDEDGTWVKTRRQRSDSVLINSKLIFECPLIHPTVMWNKYAFMSNNLWYDETYIYAQDMDLWNRVKFFYYIHIVEESLLKFRFGNSNSISFKKQDLQKNYASQITQRELLKLGYTGENPLFIYNQFQRIKAFRKVYKQLRKQPGAINNNVIMYFRGFLFPKQTKSHFYRIMKIFKQWLIN
jgi:glycosyltransferase involved in cell wall biosynthesis